jgi:hypothetical protein
MGASGTTQDGARYSLATSDTIVPASAIARVSRAPLQLGPNRLQNQGDGVPASRCAGEPLRIRGRPRGARGLSVARRLVLTPDIAQGACRAAATSSRAAGQASRAGPCARATKRLPDCPSLAALGAARGLLDG